MDPKELSPGDEIAPAIPQPNEGRIINVSSASTSHQNSYDVFLSFRGEDTRYNFISHLYSALSNRGIYTFIDDKLRQGEELEPALVQAMDNSRIAVVIFSENYANSSWCLDELVKILEFKELMGQIVVPIFYKVDPSDVRKQSGNFAEALTRHEDRMQNPEKAKTWKVGLSKAANLSCWHLKSNEQRQEIPEIPPNISHLFAEGCESLEGYLSLSNMLKSHPSQSSLLRRIELFGCDKLNPQDINVHKMLSIECQELLEKARVDILHPGSEVPKWFLYHSTEESPENHILERPESQVPKWFHLHSTEQLLRFEVPSNLYPKVAGLAFCVVAEIQNQTNISCEIQLFINKQRTYGFVERFPSLKSDHTWLSYVPRNLMWGLDTKLREECSRFGVLFKVSGAVLGSCGVHLVCHLKEKQQNDIDIMQTLHCMRNPRKELQSLNCYLLN